MTSLDHAGAASARETFKALYAHVRPHRWVVALGLLCALVGATGGLLQPLATKVLVDRLASGGTITGILLALTALVVLGAIVDALGAYVLERTAESVVLAARRTLIGRLLRLRLAEAERIPPGDLMSRVTSDTTLLRAVSTEAVVAAATGTVTAAPVPASVRFAGVSFRYRPGLPDIHRQVSFDVPAAGMTAIVGPSGAGKSTVFALIERFYEATGGRVLFDGKDVRDWSLPDLRALIGYVEQDAPVLAGSLRENLTFAAPDATDDDIRDVLSRTRLATLVDRLPSGLDTPVGHRGSMLSGGERQRIAIARALLRRPRLLLLDEATSQLDAVNELALRDVIAEAAARTTVMVVAHRLSTVIGADRIIVMDAGRVRAVGTHAELVVQDQLYARLAATQLLTPA
jgi:ABC-type multidrug transport system fused ATPase/permease subunit